MGNGLVDLQDYIQRRGLKLFTCRWLPVHQEIKGLIFMCHGARKFNLIVWLIDRILGVTTFEILG